MTVVLMAVSLQPVVLLDRKQALRHLGGGGAGNGREKTGRKVRREEGGMLDGLAGSLIEMDTMPSLPHGHMTSPPGKLPRSQKAQHSLADSRSWH